MQTRRVTRRQVRLLRNAVNDVSTVRSPPLRHRSSCSTLVHTLTERCVWLLFAVCRAPGATRGRFRRLTAGGSPSTTPRRRTAEGETGTSKETTAGPAESWRPLFLSRRHSACMAKHLMHVVSDIVRTEFRLFFFTAIIISLQRNAVCSAIALASEFGTKRKGAN